MTPDRFIFFSWNKWETPEDKGNEISLCTMSSLISSSNIVSSFFTAARSLYCLVDLHLGFYIATESEF